MVYGLENTVSVLVDFDNCANYVNCEHLSRGERVSYALYYFCKSKSFLKFLFFISSDSAFLTLPCSLSALAPTVPGIHSSITFTTGVVGFHSVPTASAVQKKYSASHMQFKNSQ